MLRRFTQVDVFTRIPLRGNPLAVVIDADGLSDDDMARFASWTNLSETSFLFTPSDPTADYRVRIFTTTGELPFAGHPTLGTCRAWLDHASEQPPAGVVTQECGIGLVRVRGSDGRLAFAAPPLIRSGPVADDEIAAIERALGTDVVDATWADNGPGWIAVELADDAAVRAARPDLTDLPDIELGVVGRCAEPNAGFQFEVRAFFPIANGHAEDPVTGSLNASVAVWLMGRDPSLRSYVARQGSALGREGRVHVDRDPDGTIWVGGHVVTLIDGTVDM